MFDAAIAAQAQYASSLVTAPPGLVERAPMRPVTPKCIVEEAARQSLPILKLISVMKVENGRVGEFRRNDNGSYDVGPMQINTVNIPEIARKVGTDPVTALKLIAYDGCFNVAIGAWILRQRTDEADGDFWFGIGRYHSKTIQYRNTYILKVHEVMTRLAAEPTAVRKPANGLGD